MRRAVVALLVAFGATVAAAPAVAQPAPAREDVARAKTLFDAGAQAYAAGDYEAALQAFEEAQRLAPRAAIVFSMAQAHRRQFYVGHDEAHASAAIALYRRYLDEVPRGGRRSDAVDALGELESRARRDTKGEGRDAPAPQARLMVTSPAAGAEIALDEEPFGAPPLIRPVAPGTHRIRVRARGFFEETRQQPVVEGAFVPIDVPLRPRPASLDVVGPPGAALALDGRVVATLPLAKPLLVAAGGHHLEVIANGRRSWQRDVSLERGGATSLTAELTRSPTRWVATGLLGTGAAAIVVGGVLGALSLGRESDARDLRDAAATRQMTAAERADYEIARAARDDLRAGAVVAVGGGVATALVGAGLWIFDTPGPTPRPPPVEVPPAPGERAPIREIALAPIPGGVAVAGHF